MNGHRQTIPRWLRRYATIALAVSSCLAVASNGQGPASSEQWVARVGDRTISVEAFARRYADFLASTGVKDNLSARSAILENMINEVSLLHFDSPSRDKADKDHTDAVERARRRVILAYLKDREIFAKIRVTEREARQAYERAHERIAARHLYAQTEEEANELKELLNIGVDFDLLARMTFTDSTLRANGGLLGYFAWGDMDPAFEDAAYALRVGEVSPPVRTAHGFSIIRVEDRLPHPLLTEQQFQQKRSHIERVVKIRKKRKAEEDYLQKVFPAGQLIFEEGILQGMAEDLQRPRALDVERRSTTDPSTVCVRFNGRAYTRGEILSRLHALPGDQKERIASASMVRAAVRGVLLQDRLLAIACEKGYDTLSVVLDAFRQAQDALFLRRRIVEITNERDVSDSEAVEYYRKNIPRFSSENELNIQEVILSDRKLADSLRQAIDLGSDLGAIAKRHSLRKWSATNGGILGFAPLSRFGQLKETLWKSSVGDLVGPLPIAECYGLFRILGKRDSKPLPLGEVRERVRRMLRLEEHRTTVRDYLTRLQQQIGVEIDRERLASYEIKDMAVSH